MLGRESGELEYHKDKTGYLEGYDYVAEAGASTDAAYDFVNSQGSSSLLNEVTVTTSLFENLETFGENVSNLTLSDIENTIEAPLNAFGSLMEERLGPKTIIYNQLN